MNNLFVDPKKYPKDITWAYLPDEEYILIRTFDHFVRHIETNGIPKFISMDCELGKDCAKWLGEYCQKFNLDIPSYMVHSKNKIEGKKVSNILAFYIFSKNDKK
jgi:hypothetical protein